MKLTKIIVYIGVIISLTFIVSCKSSKKVTRENNTEKKGHKEFFEQLERDAFHFETISAKLKVNLNLSDNSLSSRVDLKMVKDKALQLSVQPFLGIEVCRILISKDSIIILDRMNKRYVAEDLEALRGQTPVDFNFFNLQALFTNRIFLPGTQVITSQDYRYFSLKQQDGNAEIKVKDTQGLVYQFAIDRENKLTQTYVEEKSGKYSVQWNYKDFQVVEKQLFPMQMNVQVMDDEKSRGGMELHFNRIELNKVVDLDFSIPSKYTRITFAQIVKSLTHNKK